MTETLTVKRGSTDGMSKRTTDSTHTVEGIMSWGGYRPDWNGQESARQSTEVYVKRGADVRARDRIIRANGEKYVVVGAAQWDQDHPINGRDFHWAAFQLESVNG